MINTSSNNKRIAKNTAMLYIRMLLIMAVTLYTSRVVLKALGVEDFGIYNVVAGVVSLLGFLNTSLSNASSRFFNFSIAEGNIGKRRKTFCSILAVQCIFVIFILVFAETIGLWLVQNKLVIPENRYDVALWAYQGSIVITVISFLSTPYNSLIIAHERMSVFAIISIIESILKLLVAYVISILDFDKLLSYAILLVLIQLFVWILYHGYSKYNFIEMRGAFVLDRESIKKIVGFSFWTMGGNIAVISCTQGLNVLLNMFFGPVVNAARAVAIQVQNAINHFFTSFQTAINPQIIQSYASGNIEIMHTLIINSAKYSFYLSLLIVVPVLFQTKEILQIWLGVVPDYTVYFVRIMIFVGLNYAIGNSIITAVRATGNIRKFELIVSVILLSILPICYLLLKILHLSAEDIFLVYCLIECIAQFVRVYVVFPQIKLPVRCYYTKVLFPILKVCIFVWIIPYILLCNLSGTLIFNLIIMVGGCTISSLICIYLLGLNRSERCLLHNRVKQYILKVK